MRAAPPHPRREAGFSLLELMVATLLGTILAAGIVSVYAAGQKDYARNSELGSVEKSARLSLGALDQKIRMAGFFGCGHDTRPTNLLQTESATYDAATPVQGYEYLGTGMGTTYPSRTKGADAGPEAGDWSPSLPPDISQAMGVGRSEAGASAPGSPMPGSDVLMLHEAAPSEISLAAPYTDGAEGLYVAADQGSRLAPGDVAVVSDCTHADLFQVTGVSSSDRAGGADLIRHAPDASLSPGNAAPGRFDHAYGAGSQLYLYQTYLYYIGRDRIGSPALYQLSLGPDARLGKPIELADGVESMQFLYGVDTDGDAVPNRYLTADQVADWGQVVNIRIALLVRSSGGGNADSAGDTVFSLLDPVHGLNWHAPADGRIRKVFGETVSIRNRLP